MAMELPLEHVLRENGPIDQMAERLISGAQREAGVRAQPVDVVHLMMAVVLDPWPIHEVHDSPAIRMLLSDARAMDELRGALRMQMNAQPFNSPQRSHPSGPLYGTTAYEPLCTGALRRCMELARKHWPTLPLNDSMLVWAVLNDNNDARDAVIAILADLPEHRFDAIVSDLEGRVRRNAPYHEPMSYPAVDHSRWMPIKLLPHPTYQHLVRHRGLMLEIADAIQGREHGQIVLVSGHNGSPLHHVAQILTDAIGEGTIHFGDIQSVWWADVMKYLTWADPPVTAGAETLLEESIDFVKAQGGVLVLEHLEKLKETPQLMQTPLQRRLIGQLWTPSGAAIVALYEVKDLEQPDSVMEDLSLSEEETKLVPIEPYNAENALNSLRDNFVPAWQARGFVFHGDVQDSASGPYHDVLALMGGAMMHGKHMALPYLLVDVTEHLFTRRDEPGAIKNWAQAAQDRVSALLTEKPGTHPAAVVRHYQPLLNEALQQVRPLVDKPALARRGEQVVVTRGHLTTAFLGSPLSRFSYPEALRP